MNAQDADAAGRISFLRVDPAGRDAAALVRDYEQKILKKELDGLLLVPADVKEARQVSYYSTSVSDFTTIKFIESTLRTAISKQLLLEKQIDPAVVDEATREISMETFKVKKEGTTKSDSGMDYMMSLFMIVILFIDPDRLRPDDHARRAGGKKQPHLRDAHRLGALHADFLRQDAGHRPGRL